MTVTKRMSQKKSALHAAIIICLVLVGLLPLGACRTPGGFDEATWCVDVFDVFPDPKALIYEKYWLLSLNQVQEDLALDQKQLMSLKEAYERPLRDMEVLHKDASAADVDEKSEDLFNRELCLIYEARVRHLTASLLHILTPAQNRRLMEIAIQVRGPIAALLDSTTLKSVGLSKEETDYMMESVIPAYEPTLENLFAMYVERLFPIREPLVTFSATHFASIFGTNTVRRSTTGSAEETKAIGLVLSLLVQERNDYLFSLLNEEQKWHIEALKGRPIRVEWDRKRRTKWSCSQAQQNEWPN